MKKIVFSQATALSIITTIIVCYISVFTYGFIVDINTPDMVFVLGGNVEVSEKNDGNVFSKFFKNFSQRKNTISITPKNAKYLDKSSKNGFNPSENTDNGENSTNADDEQHTGTLPISTAAPYGVGSPYLADDPKNVGYPSKADDPQNIDDPMSTKKPNLGGGGSSGGGGGGGGNTPKPSQTPAPTPTPSPLPSKTPAPTPSPIPSPIPSPTPTPERGFKVEDAEQRYQDKTTANINVFGKEKFIAPGLSGKYVFDVDNTYNDYSVDYDMRFSEDNQAKLPMLYKLKLNGSYVGTGEWVAFDKITVKKNIGIGKKDNYILEWLWYDDGDSNRFLKFARESYTIKVTIDAVQN